MFVAMPTAIPDGTVDQQVGELGRKDLGLFVGRRVVGPEVDRLSRGSR